jgi:hypothetical protein
MRWTETPRLRTSRGGIGIHRLTAMALASLHVPCDVTNLITGLMSWLETPLQLASLTGLSPRVRGVGSRRSLRLVSIPCVKVRASNG